MTASQTPIVEHPIAVDLLAHAIDYMRPRLNAALPISERIRNLWAAVVASRDLAPIGRIENDFLHLACEAGLIRDLGQHGEEDVKHVIHWAIRDQNPFN
jgi:hypothetical protein